MPAAPSDALIKKLMDKYKMSREQAVKFVGSPSPYLKTVGTEVAQDAAHAAIQSTQQLGRDANKYKLLSAHAAAGVPLDPADQAFMDKMNEAAGRHMMALQDKQLDFTARNKARVAGNQQRRITQTSFNALNKADDLANYATSMSDNATQNRANEAANAGEDAHTAALHQANLNANAFLAAGNVGRATNTAANTAALHQANLNANAFIQSGNLARTTGAVAAGSEGIKQNGSLQDYALSLYPKDYDIPKLDIGSVSTQSIPPPLTNNDLRAREALAREPSDAEKAQADLKARQLLLESQPGPQAMR
jgi:hypothetical protein